MAIILRSFLQATILNLLFLLGAITLFLSAYFIYNVWFHPLSKFPGPIKAAISPIWSMRGWVGGHYVKSIKELHDRYGPVVRVAPNHLSFCSATSWKEIYGHVPGRKQFLKGSFYEPLPGEEHNLLSQTNLGAHATMRRELSHGFSATALSEQQDLIHHFVDLLMSQIEKYGTSAPIDMVKWYNFTTFDIIGELSFGEPFGNLETGVMGQQHFWVDTIFQGIQTTTFLRSFEYFPPLRSFFRYLYKNKLLPSKISAPRRRQWQYAHDKLQKRLQTTPPRIDFLTKMISKKEDGISLPQLQAQANLLTVAGSETTATSLSGITYHICANDRVHQKLAREVREAFDSYDQINGRSTESLPYLKAVIDEGLRLYPPVPIGLPRISPGETVDGHYIPKNTIVYTSSWAATHSEDNFHHAIEFRPERWIESECQDKKQASQPYGLGSRACLGRNLAQLEMQIIVAKLVWTYDFKLMNLNLDWDGESRSYVFWQKPELPVQFQRRHLTA